MKNKFIDEVMPEIRAASLTFMYFYFVYATYLGRGKWLGEAFFYLFTKTILEKIPLAVVLCFSSIMYVVIVGYVLKKYLRCSNVILICLGTTIFCGVVWYPLSFISYYSGVEGRIKENSSLLYKTTKIILYNNSLDESEKKEALDEIYRDTNMRAILRKDGKEYIKTDFLRSIIENPSNDNAELLFRGEFDTDGSKYTYLSSYVYRSDLFRGVARALTWSWMPDRYDGVFLKERYNIDIESNEAYVMRRKAGRSMNWWLIFTAVYGLACISVFEYNKIKQKLKYKEKEMEEQYKNTGLYQELLFKQLMVEFNDVITSGAKNSLQTLIDSGNNNKKVYTEAGFQGTVSAIGDAVGDEIHLLKNKWNAEVNFEDSQEKLIKIILNDLRKLNRVFSIEYEDTSISNVESIVKNSIPKTYYNRQGFSFIPLTDIEIDDSDSVKINQHRLSSIVKNLLQNSDNANNNYHWKVLDKEKRKLHKSQIVLSTGIEEEHGNKYYTICVKDTGGGFPAGYIGKIYEEPVETTDPSRKGQKGGGTAYIGMFVKRMDGKIKAENYVGGNGYHGAMTKIYLPIQSKK